MAWNAWAKEDPSRLEGMMKNNEGRDCRSLSSDLVRSVEIKNNQVEILIIIRERIKMIWGRLLGIHSKENPMEYNKR